MPTDIGKLNLQQAGFCIPDSLIYSPTSASIASAVAGLGRQGFPFMHFCTAEIVSGQGLMLTNYHCAINMIQQHSTASDNLFDKGFWAASLDKELRCKGITASVVSRIIDVTDVFEQALSAQGIIGEAARSLIIDSISSLLEKNIGIKQHETIAIKEYYEGNKFYATVYTIYKDIRIVGFPPRNIGKFGGETDNWEWPRHTADFCFLRIYADSLGLPADYSISNLPLAPQTHLQISAHGYSEGDLAMIMGFPGKTERYIPSQEIADLIDRIYPERILIREAKLAELKKYSSDPAIYIAYSTKMQSISNYYKNFRGQISAVKANGVINIKKAEKKELEAWANASRYQGAIPSEDMLDSLYAATLAHRLAEAYHREAFLAASDAYAIASRAIILRNAFYSVPFSAKAVKAAAANLASYAEVKHADYVEQVDKELFQAGATVAMQRLSGSSMPAYLQSMKINAKADYKKAAGQAHSRSVFSDPAKFSKFIANPKITELEKDPLFQLAISFSLTLQALAEQNVENYKNTNIAKRQLAAARMSKMQADSIAYYPDANSTLRLTYGKIKGYRPRDGVFYSHSTSVKGLLEKNTKDKPDYYANPDILDMLRAVPGIPACFISEADITGGNSGSPVINASGNLIGIAFDGNWEAMSGDIMYHNELQRTISVDIRFVLFLTEQLSQSKRIISELDILE
jgi:hypothetical protein